MPLAQPGRQIAEEATRMRARSVQWSLNPFTPWMAYPVNPNMLGTRATEKREEAPNAAYWGKEVAGHPKPLQSMLLS